jgi:hypothetical protein
MNKSSVLVIFGFSLLSIMRPEVAFAQKESFGLITYLPPKGWKKEVKENSYTSYTSMNKQNKTWCQIFIMLSVPSKGGINEDFDSEWQSLIVTPYRVTEKPAITEPVTKDGWQVKGGTAPFTFNNGKSTALLTTMSGYNKVLSIVAVTNSKNFMPALQSFLESVDMKKPSIDDAVNKQISQTVNQSTIKQPTGSGMYTFTTTNFDDGWTATEETDWVRVTKGNVNVLLHFTKEGTTIAADPEPHISNAWNILVAPRYSNLTNYKVASPSLDPQRAYLGAGNLTDNKNGKQVYVALFRKGSSGWVEFIAPDKNTFVKEFGADINNIGWDAGSNIWAPLLKMMNYNKFAVAASDLTGNWKSSSGAGIEYYNIYTGNNMGLASASSTTEFIFQNGGNYTSIYKGVDGFNGNNRYAGETFNGKAIVTNWEMELTNRFKGATETFTIQFEAVKGGRILHMYRGNIEELHLFKIK